MIIKQCNGYELEKAQSNTSEDFFNRSEVVFNENGEEKTFHLLYVRYFDELLPEVTPFKQEPLFVIQERNIYFKDIVALVCLLSNPSYRTRKRVYINSQEEFLSYFKTFNYQVIQDVFKAIAEKRQFAVEPSMIYSINQH